MAKIQEYRDQSVTELETVYTELCKSLFHLRNEQHSSGRMEKPHLIGEARRSIARVLTALKEKRQAVAE